MPKEIGEMRKHLESAIKVWACAERRLKGNAFATEHELKAILSDPLAFADLLKGVDAYQFVLIALNEE